MKSRRACAPIGGAALAPTRERGVAMMLKSDWIQVGAVAGSTHVETIVASDDGYALVTSWWRATFRDGANRLLDGRGTIRRVTAGGMECVFQETGWVAAVDGVGPIWFVVQAEIDRRGKPVYRV